MYATTTALILVLSVLRVPGQNLPWGNTTSGLFIKTLTELKMTEKIKQDILVRLGMNARPTAVPYAAERGREYAMYLDKTVTTSRSEVNEIVSFSEPPDKFQDEKIIQFRFSKNTQAGHRLKVESASLLIKVKSRQRQRRKQPRGIVAETGGHHSRGRGKKRRGTKVSLSVSTVTSAGRPAESIAVIKYRIKKNKWFKVSLNQDVMQKLVDVSNGTVLLYVQCRGCRKHTRVVLVQSKRRRKRTLKGPRPKSGGGLKLNKARPLLILHTFLESGQRDKRSVASQCSSVSERCCKRQLYLDFANIGWDDWIIHPRGFTMAECFGGCQDNPEGETESRSECVPTRKRRLRLVYRETTGLVRRSVLPNFIVTRCGCGSRNQEQ